MKTVDDINRPTHAGNGGGSSGLPATGPPAAGPPATSPSSPDRAGLLGRLTRSGRVARSTAAVWMTLLIALPIVVAFLTVWGGLAKATRPDDLSLAALKVFGVWCLSFLPGWLYVRFLGQRAGALWNEYVLHLHRLGWDNPENLPMPPRNSEFYEEWHSAGGDRHAQGSNLYQQKFSAYYGRSVSETSSIKGNFSVRTETMFPVFLATVVLAVCWVAVLWDTPSATEPATV
jgi:hypothetical protein